MKINSINNTYNRQMSNNKKVVPQTTAPAFKGGISENVIGGMSKFYEGLASKEPFQNFVKNFSKSNKTFTHLMIGESIFLSGFYMINTLKNKKIKKEQKPQMIINDALTLGVSCAGAYFFDDKITSIVKKGSEKYFAKNSDFYTQLGKKTEETLLNSHKSQLLEKVSEVAASKGDALKQGVEEVSEMMRGHLKNIVGEAGKLKTFQIDAEKMDAVKNSVQEAVLNNKGNAEKAKEVVKGLVDDVYSKSAARFEAEKAYKGINKLKVLVIFGIIYRYLGPVVITPIANKLSSKFFNNKKEEKTDNKQTVKTDEKK